MSDGLDARRAAAFAYHDALRKKRPLDAALASANGFAAMEARDRAFARSIAATTFRRTGQTRSVLKAFLSKPFEEAAPGAQSLLMTGATQLLWMDVPAHAVVSSAVELAAERPETRKLKGLINAVLRKVDQEGRKLTTGLPPQNNLPDWLRTAWRKTYGPGKLARIADAHLTTPPVDITLKHPDQAKEWAVRLDADVLPTGSLRRPGGGDVTQLPGFSSGDWWVQDAAAAIPAKLIGARPGEYVVDLCAAPGGKTMQMAANGARVTAIDVSSSRLERVSENLERTGLEARITATDGRGWTPKKPVDAVLVDAPCTATGTMRRHPEAAWIKSPDDLKTLKPLQSGLIKAAVRALKPGGRLILCTCSLQAEEGEGLARDTLKTHCNLRTIPVTPDEVPGLADALTPEGWIRLTPAMWAERGGLDGFFIARFEKTA